MGAVTKLLSYLLKRSWR